MTGSPHNLQQKRLTDCLDATLHCIQCVMRFS